MSPPARNTNQNKPLFLAAVGRKGGSGKTALCLSLAAIYSRAGKRVLLIDLDPQGSASLVLGADDATGYGLRCLLDGEAAVEKVTYDTFFEGLQCLAGGPEVAETENPQPLRDVVGNAADVVLMDCPPGHAQLDRLAMEAADVLLVCCEPHRMALAGAARVLDEVKRHPNPPPAAVVLSRLDDRRGLDKTAPELLAGAFSLPVYPVHQDSRLSYALNAGELPPAVGRAAADVQALAAWINRQKRKGPA